MKTCYYNHTGHVSGAERVLFMIMDGLGAQDEAVLIAPKSPGIEAFAERRKIKLRKLSEFRARFTRRPDHLFRYLISALGVLIQFRSIVRRENPDLIHANSTRAGLIAAVATIGMRTPVLWHIHDILPHHPISSAIRLIALASSRNRILAVSQATADRFRGKLMGLFAARVPIDVVHNGIDVQPADSRSQEAASFLHSLGLTPDEFKIGIVGQINPRKGHLALIRSFAALCINDLPLARLLVVGSPIFNRDFEYFELIKAEARRLGIADRVIFTGHRDDIPAVLQSLDALVLNSSSEPFSMVLLEALAHATPVAATRVDGVPELIVDGVSGQLFELGDEAGLNQILRTWASDRNAAKLIGNAGRARVATCFSRDSFLQNVRRSYKLSLMSCATESNPASAAWKRTNG